MEFDSISQRCKDIYNLLCVHYYTPRESVNACKTFSWCVLFCCGVVLQTDQRHRIHRVLRFDHGSAQSMDRGETRDHTTDEKSK